MLSHVFHSLFAGNDIGIQGNLDPAILYGDHATIKVIHVYDLEAGLDPRTSSCCVVEEGWISFLLSRALLRNAGPESQRVLVIIYFVFFLSTNEVLQHNLLV